MLSSSSLRVAGARAARGCPRTALVSCRWRNVFTSPVPLPPLPAIGLSEYILERASSYGERPALVDGLTGSTIRYDELGPMIERTAEGLASRGLRQDDVLAIVSPNRIEYPVVLHAATLLGAKVTPVNPAYTPYEIGRQLVDAQATQVGDGTSA